MFLKTPSNSKGSEQLGSQQFSASGFMPPSLLSSLDTSQHLLPPGFCFLTVFYVFAPVSSAVGKFPPYLGNPKPVPFQDPQRPEIIFPDSASRKLLIMLVLILNPSIGGLLLVLLGSHAYPCTSR